MFGEPLFCVINIPRDLPRQRSQVGILFFVAQLVQEFDAQMLAVNLLRELEQMHFQHVPRIVVHGDGMGQKLGFPTANVQMKHNLPPLTGIYVVEAHSDGIGVLQGVASLGVRPTVHHDARHVLEVHLFEFAQQIYGKHLRVEFLHKLRDEEKYPNLEALTQQIARDVNNAKQWFVDL